MFFLPKSWKLRRRKIKDLQSIFQTKTLICYQSRLFRGKIEHMKMQRNEPLPWFDQVIFRVLSALNHYLLSYHEWPITTHSKILPSICLKVLKWSKFQSILTFFTSFSLLSWYKFTDVRIYFLGVHFSWFWFSDIIYFSIIKSIWAKCLFNLPLFYAACFWQTVIDMNER